MTLTLEERAAAIEANIDLIELAANIALGTISRRGYSAPADRRELLRNDLVSHGRLVLTEAARDFKSEVGVPFRLFARQRLLLRIFDPIRRRNLKELSNHQLSVQGKLGGSRPLWAQAEAEQEMSEEVRQALSELPIAQYAYLSMRYAGGRSIKVIAADFGVKLGEVHREMQAGMATLRTVLKGKANGKRPAA